MIDGRHSSDNTGSLSSPAITDENRLEAMVRVTDRLLNEVKGRNAVVVLLLLLTRHELQTIIMKRTGLIAPFNASWSGGRFERVG